MQEEIIRIATRLKFLIFIIFIANFSNISFAKDLIYSGFSLQGNFSFNEINYPNFSKLLDDNNLNKQLYQIFQNEPNLIMQKSDDDDRYVVSFGLITELFTQEKINEVINNTHIIYPQIFVYDNKSKNFVQAISSRYQFGFRTDPSSQDKTTNFQERSFKEFEQHILGNKNNINFIGRCTKDQVSISFLEIYKVLYKCLDLEEVDRFNLQVREVELGDSEFSSYSNQEAIQYKLANLTTAAVSSVYNPDQFLILPFSKEQSIAIALNRFSDTNNLNINLPEPDFVIDIKINGNLKKKVSEDEDEAAFMYAMGINFKILEPLSEKIIFDGNFKKASKTKIPKDLKTKTVLIDYDADIFNYSRLYEELITDITKYMLKNKLDNSDKDMIKEIANNKEEYKKIVDFHKNIQSVFFKK